MRRIGPTGRPTCGVAGMVWWGWLALLVFGGVLCAVGIWLIQSWQENIFYGPEWSDPEYDESRDRIDQGNRCVNL